MVPPTYAQQLKSLSLKMQEMRSARRRLVAQLADLDAEYRAAQREYDFIRSNASPIGTIPNEILAIIFEEMHSFRYYYGQFELHLSQVARRWRDVAINARSLWSEIDIYVNKPQKIELISLYLSRSKSAPFDLTARENLHDNNCQVILGQLLADHIHHCRQLRFKFCSMECARAILDFLAVAHAPLLESFDVEYLFTNLEVLPATILTGGTPMLTHMNLAEARFYLPPLYNVTSLYLNFAVENSFIDTQELKDIFSSLTRLVSLMIEGGIVNYWMPGPPVTLPALQTLRMVALQSDQFKPIYNAIDAPLLEFFSLDDCENEDLDWFRQFWHLGPTKFPTLHTLTILYADTMTLPLKPFMRAFPHLGTVTFKWQNRAHFRQVLRMLLKTDAPGPYWPRLRHLASDLPRFNRHNDTHELIASVLTHRISIGHPIETLTVSKEVIAGAFRCAAAWTKLVEVVEYEINDDDFSYINYPDNEEVEDDSEVDV